MMISIVIPTYNRSDKLTSLLNSLVPQVRKNLLENSVEILVVDDHSQQAVVDRIRNLWDRDEYSFLKFFWLERNRGPSFARNYGLSRCTGEIIVFLDDDCILEPNYVLETIRVHKEHPEALVVNGNLKKLRDSYLSNFWFYNYNAAFNRKGCKFYRVNRLSSGNFSIKRTLLKKINPIFDQSLPSREDYDLYLRFREKKIDIYKSDDIVAHYDCRDSLVSFIKQRIWYSKGEYYLRKKHNLELIIADQEAHRLDIRQDYPYLAILLGLVWRLSMKYWKLRDRVSKISPY
ncbi:MAG TPA: glycosyltransferase family 2 protein [Thermodesulfobacteriota bacterium]|nr:glycosyltransferase family 2 protein [Thermodesulfobacteriota bacterium]